MQPDDSLPRSQKPTYSEPDESSPHFPMLLL
jgi:hypothetical protein